MLRPFYRIVPSAILKFLTLEVRAFREVRDLRLGRTVQAAPLHGEHIANLRVVTDRLALLQELPANGIVAEIGVFKGDFSDAILDTCTRRRLHLIDAWSRLPTYKGYQKQVEERFASHIADGTVTIDAGMSVDVLARYDDGYFDWVYIDTAHDYKTTAVELALCRSKVKRGGIIAGHDYTVGSWQSDIRYGVIAAVNAFCIEHDWEMIYLTHEPSRTLSFALRELQGT